MKTLYGVKVEDFEPGWWPNGNKCYRINEHDSAPIMLEFPAAVPLIVSWWDYERTKPFEFLMHWPLGWRYGRFVCE